MSDPVIRPLDSVAELREAVALQEEVWGDGFSERTPVSVMKVAVRLGGVASGAFVGDELVGFVFGLTGLEDGRPVHWSHMLAVRPGRGGAGLGRRLKLHQRERLLAGGVTRALWSFDPLESRNAWLNLGRLGAVATEYVTAMYGRTDSPRHRGVGTDRLVALWELDAPRVRERLDAPDTGVAPAALDDLPRAFDVETDGGVARPVGPTRIPPRGSFVVPIPRELQSVIDRDPDTARAWREATRDALRPALEEGRRVTELLRGDSDGTSSLLVEEA